MNDTNNCNTYGGLYQWNETMQYVTTQGIKGICPDGWHLPTLAEFETLKALVNNDGNSLKAIGQGTGGGAGTNTSGFSALLSGLRNSGGTFFGLGNYAPFWSSTESNADDSYYFGVSSNSSNIPISTDNKGGGFCVRCVKD